MLIAITIIRDDWQVGGLNEGQLVNQQHIAALD